VADQLPRVAGVTRGVRVASVRSDMNRPGRHTGIPLAVDPSGRLGFRRQPSKPNALEPENSAQIIRGRGRVAEQLQHPETIPICVVT